MCRFRAGCANACRLLQVDTILSTLRLESAADTVVGNEFIRGVSGGEKRRLTLAEMLVRCAVVCCCPARHVNDADGAAVCCAVTQMGNPRLLCLDEIT